MYAFALASAFQGLLGCFTIFVQLYQDHFSSNDLYVFLGSNCSLSFPSTMNVVNDGAPFMLDSSPKNKKPCTDETYQVLDKHKFKS